MGRLSASLSIGELLLDVDVHDGSDRLGQLLGSFNPELFEARHGLHHSGSLFRTIWSDAVFRMYGTKGLRNWSFSGPLLCEHTL